MTDDTDPSPTCQALRTALGTRLSAEALDWLDRGIERVSASAEPLAPLAPIFAAASRRLAGISLGSALAWVGDPLAALTTPAAPWTQTAGPAPTGVARSCWRRRSAVPETPGTG